MARTDSDGQGVEPALALLQSRFLEAWFEQREQGSAAVLERFCREHPRYATLLCRWAAELRRETEPREGNDA